jgi:hypothetical protein
MSFLELYPIFVALHLWIQRCTDKVVIVQTDNEALVPILNRLYSKDHKISALLRPIALLCMRNNVVVQARHIAGKLNVGADLLSRDRITQFRAQMPQKCGQPTELPHHLQPAAVWANYLV